MGVEVEVTGIAAGGAGVGRLPDGRVTFVHRTAPGDRALVRIVEEKPRWTRSELVRVLEPGPGRREAPCPHYDRCGGCTLEHLDYPAQLMAKATLVRDALRRIGGLDVARPEIVPSPAEFRYRNRVSFTLRRGEAGVVAGFHELGHPDRIVDITAGCLLPEEPLAKAWGELRAGWGSQASRLPSGAELRLTLRSAADGAVTLVIDGGYAPGRPSELVERVPSLRAIWHRPGEAAAEDVGGRVREYRHLAGDPSITDTWSEEEVELSGDVFTQVNRGAAALLQDHVVGLIEAGEPASVLDAYCGVGLYSRRLCRAGVDVTGVEAHPLAAAEAKRAAPEARVLAARVEEVLDRVLPVEAAVLNPPRAGLDDRVPGMLKARPPARLVYVSCDPATLARDLKRLGEAYRIESVRCFDMFPQTAHVETVVELRCVIS